MKKRHYLSYRTQIFIASLSLVICPSVLLGLFAVNDSTSRVISEYSSSLATITSQANLTLDTLLQDAAKVTNMPILSEDIRRIMNTNYQNDYLSYAQDSTIFRDYFNQTNQLNSTLESCIFKNRYDYTFEYNTLTALHAKTMNDNIEKWAPIARQSPNYTYFAPLQNISGRGMDKTVLPMIKILRDKNDYKEIGVCYCEINFKPIENILISAQSTENILLIYSADNELAFSSNSALMQEPEKYDDLLTALAAFNASLTGKGNIIEDELEVGHSTYRVNGCVNQTTNWHLVQFVDNHMTYQIYRDNILSYVRIFLLCLVLGMCLAILLSTNLTRSIFRLCGQIDSLNPEDGGRIDEQACGSNQELRKLVASFNHLSFRLTTSIQQNYQLQINEQKMRIQMLQFQINHHFLYNTLNIIKSLANIHNVPEIETISLCMSDLLRYNLEKFPVALLKEELQQVNRYMTIQNIRFPGKFTFDCNIPSSLLKMPIPVFLLQPLVENSIEHGFACHEDNCYISITSQLEGSRLHLLIADNGDGIEADRLLELNRECADDSFHQNKESGRRSIGIRNVCQRIRSYFGPSYGLTIESMPGEGTIIDILLPAPAPLVKADDNAVFSEPS
ncbi:sensor histidine kinase [Parablautia muri]|uniref:Sensor histidine kinase n=1 Tax=Parablautia muri TaxID=2320879 RepID=A0A9X5BI02_9FIRM|nr:histidine kinase [Parablautia muri]NBJ94384.1 sensor histidine kinase [Parablautia muri]